ncbi:hypothetical protein ACEQ8H_006110 [Pleosporales sp. CAS-2024a]
MPATAPFLSILPPELRLRIYTQLLVASTPLKGQHARRSQNENYGLHTAIMRTNKEIYSETRHVFFGSNTFSVSSLPPTDNSGEGSGAFEPPLQLKDLHLIRHVEIDLLYYARILKTATRSGGSGWQPTCHGAGRYLLSMSYVLDGVKDSLRSLHIKADVRPYVDATDEEGGLLDMSRFITGFNAADASLRFKQAIASLPTKQIQLRFDFTETFFDFKVERDVLSRWSWVYLAGQVALRKSEIELKEVMKDLNEEEIQSIVGVRQERGTIMLECTC